MAIDPYASCLCGSGKKFKWCCQDIHSEVDQAFAQFNAGQHEAAIRRLEDLTKAHPSNPEAWGRYAQGLGLDGRLDQAEAALEKAFAINPHYAFGYLLRGQFRMAETELLGALMLLRKAADLYSPEAKEPLSYVFELIGDLEMRVNRPVAARAALQKVMLLQPNNTELKQAFETIFGEGSRLPACARKEYTLRSPNPAPAEWGTLLESAATGKLADARDAFVRWTEAHADDAAGWFNLGLVRAWLGENPPAVEALTKSVELENDEAKTTEAWALAEVLRSGEGQEADADYCENRAIFTVRDPNPMMAVLQHWETQRRLVGVRSNPEQGMLNGLVLEEYGGLVETAEGPSIARLGAYMLVAGSIMQLWHPNLATLDKIVKEVETRLGGAQMPMQRQRGPIMFSDVVADAMVFPTKATTELDAQIKVREQAANYFEDKWIHQPLKSLSGTAPIDAAGHANLRKRLRGTIQFIQDCAAPTSVRLYDFDRLRRKLGLVGAAPTAEGTIGDLTAMSAAELASVPLDKLTDVQLGDAFRSALKLDARELAGRFARQLTTLPVAETSKDRFPFFSHMTRLAQAESKFDDALSIVDEGEKFDCEQNEGRRRNDYELLRGQALAKRGSGPEAADVFSRLLSRSPDELKYLETATKAMLDLKQGDPARRFANQGLEKARAQNNRDAEEYFLELSDAAKRLS
ncbi:MAG: tetratricopeptide repeat protein [Gemmataceae bacterium]